MWRAGGGSDVEGDLPEAAGTHVESLEARAIRVKGRVVEVGELLRDGVDVGHGAIVISCSNGGGGSGRRRTRTSCGAVKTADGLGETRKKELVESGMKLGLRKEDDVFVVDSPYVTPYA